MRHFANTTEYKQFALRMYKKNCTERRAYGMEVYPTFQMYRNRTDRDIPLIKFSKA